MSTYDKFYRHKQADFKKQLSSLGIGENYFFSFPAKRFYSLPKDYYEIPEQVERLYTQTWAYFFQNNHLI